MSILLLSPTPLISVSLSLSLSLCLVVGPQWNVATLVFPDGAARRVCVRVSSTVCQLAGDRWWGNVWRRVCRKEGTCVVAAQWDHYCNAVSNPRAYRLISLSFSFSRPLSTTRLFFFPRCMACLYPVHFRSRDIQSFRAAGLWCTSVVFLGLRTPLEADCRGPTGALESNENLNDLYASLLLFTYDKIHFS